MRAIDKFVAKAALPILGVAGALLIFLTVLSSNGTNNQNNGYIRVINCVISIPANVRTQTDIETCYKTVETDLHIHLARYDTSSYRR